MAKHNNRLVFSVNKNTKTHTNAPRNPYAKHPLMSKGGVHKKSKSAIRAATRRETKRLARDGYLSTIVEFFLLLKNQ